MLNKFAVLAVVSFAAFPKVFDPIPPKEFDPVEGLFPNILVEFAPFATLSGFVLVIPTGFVGVPATEPAVLGLPVGLLAMAPPPKSEVTGLLLLGAPLKPKPALAVYLLLLPAPPLNRFPVAGGGLVRAPLFAPNSEVALVGGEEVDDEFPPNKLADEFPPKKLVEELLFAAGGLVPLFWPNRLLAEGPLLLPKILVPSAGLLFILLLYENYKFKLSISKCHPNNKNY